MADLLPHTLFLPLLQALGCRKHSGAACTEVLSDGYSMECMYGSLQAYAAARMAESVLLGLDGSDDIWECAYVESDVTKLPYFASKVTCTACLALCMCLARNSRVAVVSDVS